MSSSDILYFFHRSADKAPGKGANEHADPKDYTQLSKIPNWRRILSNFYVHPFKFRGLTYNTAEHAFQASKIAIADRNASYLFCMESKSELGMGDGIHAQSGRKIVILNERQLQEWFNVREETIYEILVAKFSDTTRIDNNLLLKDVITATHNAQLWHGAPRAAAARMYTWERARATLSQNVARSPRSQSSQSSPRSQSSQKTIKTKTAKPKKAVKKVKTVKNAKKTLQTSIIEESKSSKQAANTNVKTAKTAKTAKAAKASKAASAITITFSESVENHVGMEIRGLKGETGITMFDIDYAIENCNTLGIKTEKIDLICDAMNDEAYEDVEFDEACVLILRNAAQILLSNDSNPRDYSGSSGSSGSSDSSGSSGYNSSTANDLFQEMDKLAWDTQIYSRKHQRVVNKNARWNVCFDDESQEADFENKKGTVIAFDDVPLLNIIRVAIGEILGDVGQNLLAEGNKYYNVKTTGIGYHGDTERSKVVALRLGEPIPLVYQWFYKGKPIGSRIDLPQLMNGDMYIMSQKAVGNDWQKRNITTLRHAAGAKKYITYVEKKPKK